LSQVPLKTLVSFVPATVYFQLQAPAHSASSTNGMSCTCRCNALPRGTRAKVHSRPLCLPSATEHSQKARLGHPRVRTGPAGVPLEHALHAASMSPEDQPGARLTCPDSGTLRKQKRESRGSHFAATAAITTHFHDTLQSACMPPARTACSESGQAGARAKQRALARSAWLACSSASSACSGGPCSHAHSHQAAVAHLRSSAGAADWRPPGSACRSGTHRTWTLAPRQAGTSSGARASAARHTAAPFASARRLCRCCAPRTHARSEARPACQCAAPGGSAPRHTSQACPLRRGGRYEQVASTTGHQGATSGESCTQPPADDSSCPPGAVTV